MTSLLQNPFRRMLRFVTSGQPSQPAENLPLLAEPTSFYQLSSQLASGQPFSFSGLKGKQILVVNTPLHASESLQYRELQQLAAQFAGTLVVLVFPSNDFAEAGAAAGSAAMAGTSAIIEMQPSTVTKSARQHPVYYWLSSARQNGWNEQAPPRPFTKYLINPAGELAHYFGPTLSPLSEKVIDSIR